MRRAAAGEARQVIAHSIARFALELVYGRSDKGMVSAGQLVERVGLPEILSPRIASGVPFPWEWLNKVTCGMVPGELWILAGHTSSGKSSAAIQVAVNVARMQPKAVAVFSLEMRDISVLQRAIWQVSRLDSERAKRGTLIRMNGGARSTR
jgi:replicative DNA helicase